jgi:hypothetical protein
MLAMTEGYAIIDSMRWPLIRHGHRSLHFRLIAFGLALLVVSMSLLLVLSSVVVRGMLLQRSADDGRLALESSARAFESFAQHYSERARTLAEEMLQSSGELDALTSEYDRREKLDDIIVEFRDAVDVTGEFKGLHLVSDDFAVSIGDIDIGFSLEEVRDSEDYRALKNAAHPSVLVSREHWLLRSSSSIIGEGALFMTTAGSSGDEIVLFALADPLSVVEDSLTQGFVVVGGSGTVLWENASREQTTSDLARIEWLPGSTSTSVSDRLVTTYSDSTTRWRYLSSESLSDLLRPLRHVRRIGVFGAMALICLFGAVMRISARFFIAPITALTESIRETRSLDDIDDRTRWEAACGPWIKRWYAALAIRNKVFLYYVVGVIVPSIILATYLVVSSSVALTTVARISARATVLQTANTVSFFVERLQASAMSLALSDPTQRLLGFHIDAESRSEQISEIRQLVHESRLLGRVARYVRIYDGERRLVFSSFPHWRENEEYLPVVPSARGQWGSGYREEATGYVILPYYQPIRLRIPVPYDSVDSPVFRYYTTIGYIEVGLPMSEITKQYPLLTNDSYVLSASAPDRGRAAHRTGRPGEVTGSTVAENAAAVISLPSVTFGASDRLPFRVDETTIRDANENRDLVVILTLLLALTCVGCALASRGLSRMVLLPIQALNRAMLRASDGSFNLSSLDVVGYDEIEVLAENYRRMMIRLKKLVGELNEQQAARHKLEITKRELEKKEKEAELVAFQQQINPHLLYNTFSSVKFMVKMGRASEATSMIEALGRLFKRGIYHGTPLVSISEEVEHTKAYLRIQQMRFDDRFRTEWHLDCGVERLQTVKLTLQPIVENAIQHGLEVRDGVGIVAIHINHVGDDLLISVADDGVGMSPERLSGVRRALSSSERSEMIGLQNVNERVRLQFGPEYGVTIASHEQSGTEVMLRIPATAYQPWEGADVQIVDRG